MVGVVATLVHYLAILALVDVLGWLRPTPATVIGSALGIATSYLGNHRAVFNVRGAHHRYGPRFVFVYLTVMGIHASLMFVSTEVWALAYEWGFVGATVLSAATTFVANRYLVFRPLRVVEQTR